MVLAALVGGPLGTAVGLIAGNILFRGIYRPKPVDFLTSCDQKADDDSNIPFPKTTGEPVNFIKKSLLKDTSPWLTQPDYDRALFINKILTLLWPHLSPAIHKEVMKQARAPIQEALAKIPVIEDIRFDKIDLGERPPRIDSFKSYQTYEDELILETPMFWGGDLKIRVTAVLKIGPTRIDCPIDIGDIQFKALARITIKPLVETLPCVGGVTISLLEEPTVNCDFRIGESADLLSLPGLPLLMKTAIKIVAGKMLIYPNEFTVPLMEGFGLPPPALGMLHVNVVQANNLASSLWDKVDPYVTLEVREHRGMQTTTKSNDQDPVWNESLDFVVDDPQKQHLKVVVFDDDMVTADIVGGALIDLDGAEFMATTGEPVTVKIPIYAPDLDGHFPSVVAYDNPPPGSPGSTTGSGKKKKKGVLGKLRKQKREPLVAPPPKPKPAGEEGDAEGGEVATRKQAPPGTITGTITLEITFLPFNRTVVVSPAAVAAAAVAATTTTDKDGKDIEPAAPLTPVIVSLQKQLQENSFRADIGKSKGVLTLFLKNVLNLGEVVNSYVHVRLYDPNRFPVPDIEFKTRVELNEDSPRFNFKTDFVNISSASVLTLTVCALPSTMESLTSLRVPFISKKADRMLGKVRIPLENVVKEGRVKDVYPLQEAQTGELHCTLEWASIDLGDEEEEKLEEIEEADLAEAAAATASTSIAASS